jgi:hypothetical protein
MKRTDQPGRALYQENPVLSPQEMRTLLSPALREDAMQPMICTSIHHNLLWKYEDARGVAHVGHYVRHTDHGGTDITYFFEDCASGELTLVSGSRLRNAIPRVLVPCRHLPCQGA